MINFMGNINFGPGIAAACKKLIDTGSKINKGILSTGGKVSHILYDLYSMEGFEKMAKMGIANLRAIQLIPQCNGVFKECIGTLDAQKDLIYATMFLKSTPDFIRVNVDDETGEKTYSFQIPRKKGHIDWITILYGIGNPLDTLNFLQRNQVYSFPRISQFAREMGTTQVSFLNGVTLGDIPVVNSLFNRPKDFFVFLASTLAAMEGVKNPNFFDIENLLKLTSNVGKMILIPYGETLSKNKCFVTLAAIDVATQNAGFFAMLYKRNKDRQSRLDS